MAMSEEMDAGDILLQRETPIRADDTTGTLGERLADLGAESLAATVDALRAGTVRPVPQPAANITFAPRIEPEQGRIDWSRPAAELERLVRAFNPAPSAFTTLGGARLKVHRAGVAEAAGGAPGRVVSA